MDIDAAQGLDGEKPVTRLAFGQELSEVRLLLDYVSGQTHLSLDRLGPVRRPARAPDKAGQPSSDALDSDRIVRRVCELQYPPKTSASAQADDAHFLLQARDQLNSMVSPARGRSIAFTWLVSSMAKPGSKGAEDSRASIAADAFPELVGPAWRLRRWMWVLIISMVFVGLFTVWLSGELAAGKLLLTRIDKNKRSRATLVEQIEKVEPATPATPAEHLVRYCDRTLILAPIPSAAPPETTDGAPADRSPTAGLRQAGVQQFDSAAQYHLCDDLNGLTVRRRGEYEDLAAWLRLLSPVAWVLALPTNGKGVTLEGQASVLLGALGGYILPIMYAFLGAGVSAVRTYYRKMSESLLMPRDLVMSWVRISLGLVTGSLLGLVVGPSGGPDTDASTLATGVALSGAALAFLAGYGVEHVFSFFDDLLLRVFHRPADTAHADAPAPAPVRA